MTDQHLLFARVKRPKDKAPELEINGVKDWQELARLLHDVFGSKRLVMSVRVDDAGPSDSARGYFHGVVKPYCTKGFNDLGNRYTDEQTYDELKREYEQTPIGQPTPSLSKYSDERYKDFIAWAVQFAAENLSIDIPAPTPRSRPEMMPNEER